MAAMRQLLPVIMSKMKGLFGRQPAIPHHPNARINCIGGKRWMCRVVSQPLAMRGKVIRRPTCAQSRTTIADGGESIAG